ncbi:MAG: tRNA (guanosine(37)-N1)-methyltransferase TrmD [Synergistaceae bacterium]|nr:tRNA (guanosine(37)-N1)-methyltransferase TrmD [Synergistaceae bacterium]
MKPRISIVTAFPDLIRGVLSLSVLGRGIESGKVDVSIVNIRDFAEGRYRQIDDYSFGGGGMVLMAGPLMAAVDSIAGRSERYVVCPSPQGVRLYQELVEDLHRISCEKNLVIVCGHYEGIDERFAESCADLEVSLGDFVLTGGEIPALAITDAVSRLVDGVVGRRDAVEEDSFFSGMLDHPHYTRPAEFAGRTVPDVLLGGDRSAIESFRRAESAKRTISRRPDAVARAGIMPYLGRGVYVLQLHHPVLNRNGMVGTTAITGLDLHDIARACLTYGIKKYMVATPLHTQREMIKKVASHWTEGYGASFNPDRAEAMRRVKTFGAFTQALKWVEERERSVPFSVATTAKPRMGALHWTRVKSGLLEQDRPTVFLFGTGYGLSDEVFDFADAVMAPIMGGRGVYNHLSVRSAVGIVLDRFFGFR